VTILVTPEKPPNGNSRAPNYKTMIKNAKLPRKLILLAAFLASGIVVAAGHAGVDQEVEKPAVTPPPIAASSSQASGVRPQPGAALRQKARQYYEAEWGVDILGVKTVESGLILRFSYLVVDAKKAAQLNDKKANPIMIDVKSGAELVVPTMEKIGQLRQASTPENGVRYWILFSNKGTLVKSGDLVDIEIGTFRAHGLVVQ
jgi:hypothetical protein